MHLRRAGYACTRPLSFTVRPRMAQFFFPLSALVSVTALAVCGCTQHHTPVYADPSAANFLLDALAKQIGSGLPVDSDPLGLKVDAVPAADTVRLHCRLTNISHEPITLDRLKLPCVGWWSLTVLGVTTDGRVLPQSVGVGSFLGPARPQTVTIQPAQTITTEMALQSVYPLDANPRDADVLLLWNYSHDGHVITGITLLPRKS